jgi:hypothetical protein
MVYALKAHAPAMPRGPVKLVMCRYARRIVRIIMDRASAIARVITAIAFMVSKVK